MILSSIICTPTHASIICTPTPAQPDHYATRTTSTTIHTDRRKHTCLHQEAYHVLILTPRSPHA